MRAVLIALSLALGAHASDMESTSSLVAKLQAERERKAILINQQNLKEMTELEDTAKAEEAADKTPVNARLELESQGILADAKNTVEEQMLAARNKMSEAAEMEEKAATMATTAEGVATEDQKKKLKKLAFESSFLEQEHRKRSNRERDTNFVLLEIEKLQKQQKELQAELKKKAELAAQEKIGLSTTAQIMKQEAEKELKAAENQWSGVEAVAQDNEARPKHMAPKWMIEAQLQEAKDAHSENGQKIESEKQELKLQKSYLWKQMGKKYTCAAEHNQVKAFIIDSHKDRADCLEKQLDKYCLDSLRAPAMSQESVMNLIKEPQDCLVNGVDSRVPENKHAAVASKWCNVVQVLQGVAAKPLKQKYFVLLEDHVKVDPTNFEETIKSFADEYSHNWDLLQLDPQGKHNDADQMASFNGNPVYRNSRNGQYFGFSSVVMKSDSAAKVLEKMMAMPAVPLDTLPTLLNEQDGKISAASLEADVISVPKKSSLLQSTKCSVTQSGIEELTQMSQAAKPASLLQTVQSEPLDFFAFQKEKGADAMKTFENRDLDDF